jgi:hypothetical protein
MKTPHVHAELIKAWADGAEIQAKSDNVWLDCRMPDWWPDAQYRIKPELKPDVVFYARILLPYFDAPPRVDGLGMAQGTLDNLKFVFDGTTGRLKSSEVI